MKVIYAVLSSGQQVFHPGFNGSLKGTLTGQGYKGLTMSLTGQGVRANYKGRSLIIPMHKFEFVEVEAEELVNAKTSTK